jgi:hypothetical protein
MVFLSLVVVILSLLTSACVSTPLSQGIKNELSPIPSITPQVKTQETPEANNVSPVQVIPPHQIICNCPMEPVESLTFAPTPTPDDGLCHCPGTLSGQK